MELLHTLPLIIMWKFIPISLKLWTWANHRGGGVISVHEVSRTYGIFFFLDLSLGPISLHCWYFWFSFLSSLQGRSPGGGKANPRICPCPPFHPRFWDEACSADRIWCSLKKHLNLLQSFVNQAHPRQSPSSSHGNDHERIEVRGLSLLPPPLTRGGEGQWAGETCCWHPKLELWKHFSQWQLCSVVHYSLNQYLRSSAMWDRYLSKCWDTTVNKRS